MRCSCWKQLLLFFSCLRGSHGMLFMPPFDRLRAVSEVERWARSCSDEKPTARKTCRGYRRLAFFFLIFLVRRVLSLKVKGPHQPPTDAERIGRGLQRLPVGFDRLIDPFRIGFGTLRPLGANLPMTVPLFDPRKRRELLRKTGPQKERPDQKEGSQ